MAIYPFYVTSQADGRKSPISGGCRRKYGYQTTEIMQREKGVPKTISSSHEEILKYAIFQQMVGEMYKNAKSCQHLLEMSDVELRNMVEGEDMTVKEAIANAMMNLVSDMMN